MGVLGLTPFLQKAFPEVIKELPTRLRALGGKTIAIDGNLVTQRLHFGAISSHEYRHLVGWYKIVNDLKANGVGVICVWDGKERGSAKAREVARRQAVRLLSFARGSHELGRLRRLQRLTSTVKKYQELPPTERSQVSRAVRVAAGAAAEAQLHDLADAMEKVQLSDAVEVSTRQSDRLSEFADSLGPEDSAVRLALLQHLYPPEEREAIGSFLNNIDPSDVSLVSTIDSAYEATLAAIADTAAADPLREDYGILYDIPPVEAYPYQFDERPLRPPIPDKIQGKATALGDPTPELAEPPDIPLEVSAADAPVAPPLPRAGLSYTSQPTSTPDSHAPPEDSPTSSFITEPDPSISSDAPDAVAPATAASAPLASEEANLVADELSSLYRDFQESTLAKTTEPVDEDPFSASKFQVQLTEDEKLFWNRLTTEVAEQPSDTETGAKCVLSEEAVEGLLTRSGHISSSYEKRNRLPTNATYAECRRLLMAMGVPCIEAEYPYEAEALAASLVIHGHADFVGSEDTDVLVYEAPLLRNLTSRSSPLALISGTEVRHALQLDRASYVDFALLLGTDFTKRVKNLGPHTAIKLIRAHGSIEKALEGQKRYVPDTPALYFEQVEVARLVFKTLPPVPSEEVLRPKESNEAEVWAVLKEYDIHPADLAEDGYDYPPSLAGNYYADDPSAVAEMWHTH